MARRPQPQLAPGEKAAITKAARELAKKLTDKDKELHLLRQELSDERRRHNAKTKARRNRELEHKARQEGRRISRRGAPERVYCKGLNGLGKPCKQSPLLRDRWDGPEEITGLYCLHHEPMISREKKVAFQLTGDGSNKVYRRTTPGEIAHEIMQSAPHIFLEPYLKAIGMKMDPDTREFDKVGMGLRLYGYSRGGEVIRSPYPDYVGQVNIIEKLFDRVYGKARQAVDMASMNTNVSIQISMTEDRVNRVAAVLAQAGALPAMPEVDVIDGTATDIETNDLE